jgi:hypothetical protein
MDHLWRQSQSARRPVTNDLISAIDTKQRALLTQSGDVGCSAYSHREIMIGDSAFDPPDGDGASAPIQPFEAADELAFQALRGRR